MAPTTEEVEFRASDLIGSAGVGSNGEKLIATLDNHYPPELDAALTKRVNTELTGDLTKDDVKKVAKISGYDEVANVKVRGGEQSADDAVVTYVAIQDSVVWKGCFPYSDLKSGKSDAHVSQRDSLMASPAARDHLAAQEKARAAGAATPATSGPADPIAAYEELKAPEVVAYLEEHPERAATVKAIEVATRGEDARKTILEWEPKAPEGTEGGGPPDGGTAPDGDSPPGDNPPS